MKIFYKHYLMPVLIVLVCITTSYAQTTVSGTVKDGVTGEPLAGVNIVVKGKVAGTISDLNGTFNLSVNDAPPFTLVFSFVGFTPQELEVNNSNTNLEVTMEEQTLLGQEVVVSASRVEESILQSPVTIEKLDLLAIQQTPTASFYDALASVKGVQFTSSSLNFPQVNTRGFATVSNVRFVQLVDGMDTSAPLLNFPTGNIVGIGELDVESMELVPGASSALYGPNAFNGILMMNSKSPFEYQGLSAQGKVGITTSDAQGESNPYYSFSARYAKAFNNKFAFKVNFSILTGTDWKGNDYKTDVNSPESPVDLSNQPYFNGVNLYGDETELNTRVPSIGIIHRTGLREEDLIDNYDVKSLKGDVALHYRVTDKIEVLYNLRYGGGSSIYQGSQKYALRNFTQIFNKVEIKSDNFFVRAYSTATDAGDSYNIGAVGSYVNERYNPSANWAQEYVLAMQGYFTDFGVPAGNHDAARGFADRAYLNATPEEIKQTIEDVRTSYFQKNPPGGKFTDNSKLYHGEFNYNFKNQISFAEIMIGGNMRQYNLFSDGTIFNEDPIDGTNFQRITINEFGMYTQLSKRIAEKLKLTGSIRYDKNENFEGRMTPRLSAVYTFSNNHNIRVSYQTGFRNPDTQAQFIYFPVGINTLLGSAESNASRYGVHQGGAYTRESYEDFRDNGGALDPVTGDVISGDPARLESIYVDYVKPERLSAIEIGYKGVFNSKLLVDANYYYTVYNDFIGSLDIVSMNATTHQGNPVIAGTIYTPYVNSKSSVKSQGIGLGLTYNLPQNFQIIANYNYANFSVDEGGDANFRSGFNTPENKFNVGLANRKVTKNFGFNINYRWQEDFLWESDFGSWIVPEFGVIDAQVSYRLSTMKSILKIGGTNLFGGDYRTNLGGPFVGQMYYISLTFDEFFK